MPITLNEYIQENPQAAEFLVKNPKLCADNFFAFGKEYYDGKLSGPKGAGSKFSERVFTQWIYESVEDLAPKCFPQSNQDLLIKGVKKQIDLQLKLSEVDFLIEFKCNIDNIEKDILKFLYLNNQIPRKSLFIWEDIDNSQSIRNGDSSYLRILDYFRKNNDINYFYFPLHNRNGSQYDGVAFQQKIDSFVNYLKAPNLPKG